MPSQSPLNRIRARLAAIRAAPVGTEPDGMARRGSPAPPLWGAGTELDKPWGDLQQELSDAREAWRRNPIARRLVGLVSAYVVGDGLRLEVCAAAGPAGAGPAAPALQSWLDAWWAHPENRMDSRLGAWCDELTRSGELFVTLHTNPADGMSYVRLVPAQAVDGVAWRPGDYETELSYHESPAPDDPDWPAGRTWLSPIHPAAAQIDAEGRLPPVMLHFAVNRPAGCVRGESDLAPALPWLRRYSRWLEDRVRLNAAVRSFLWVARVPGRMVATRAAELRTAPEPGSVLVVDRDNEEWQAVAPSLHASDAESDGRAIRWMIVAGGPGTGLTDLGEAETANLATAQAMGEGRERFMRARRRAFGEMLVQAAMAAHARAALLGRVEPAPEGVVVRAVAVGGPEHEGAKGREAPEARRTRRAAPGGPGHRLSQVEAG